MRGGEGGTVARRGLMLVLSSPSGAGKTTLSRRLLEVDPQVQLSVSATTRPQRPSEVDGRALSFCRPRAFRRNGAQAASCSNGRRSSAIATARRASRWKRRSRAGRTYCSISIGRARNSCATRLRKDFVSVFLLPPSVPELERRLTTRAQDPRRRDPRTAWPKRADEIESLGGIRLRAAQPRSRRNFRPAAGDPDRRAAKRERQPGLSRLRARAAG